MFSFTKFRYILHQSFQLGKRTKHLYTHTHKSHTSGAKTIFFIYSSNQKNRLGAAEYQFILLPELMCGWVKCH